MNRKRTAEIKLERPRDDDQIPAPLVPRTAAHPAPSEPGSGISTREFDNRLPNRSALPVKEACHGSTAMSRETTAGLRGVTEGPHAPAILEHGSRPRSGSVGVTLLGVALVTVGWLLFQFIFPDRLQAEFVPFLISDYQKPAVPPLPWVAADRNAIQRAGLFSEKRQQGQSGEELTLQVAGERLAKMQQETPRIPSSSTLRPMHWSLPRGAFKSSLPTRTRTRPRPCSPLKTF